MFMANASININEKFNKIICCSAIRQYDLTLLPYNIKIMIDNINNHVLTNTIDSIKKIKIYGIPYSIDPNIVHILNIDITGNIPIFFRIYYIFLINN